MILNLISLATVKTELGESTTDNDAAITAMIPKVSSDVRKILNNNFDDYYTCAFTTASTGLSLVYANPVMQMGQVIYHPNLPADTYITGWNLATGRYTLSATPTDTGDYIFPTLSIDQWSAVSKMIWYRIGKLVKTDVNDKAVASETYGKISKTYATSEINKKWNYPQALIDDLGTPFARVG